MRKGRGFTLAEVLITIGIIGIVAAITIPALMTKIQEHQTVTKLKETYSILSQAIKMAGEDVGYPEEWGVTGRNTKSANIVATNLKPYLKITTDCGIGSTFTMPVDECGFPYRVFSLKNQLLTTKHLTNFYYITLLNGSAIALYGGEVPRIYMYALVDINGSAPPNTWGKDIFEFSYTPTTGLTPSGHPTISSNSYKTTCNNLRGTGWGCAYYVLNFGKMDYLKKK
ncbi:MAG: prepilin-type N-terminal cleavage/methylation domain-containing protein [Muribaculaceae bacterium]|nr:prepilin-type N-terminal cleavage/methylation domain-containing protein [Muribaculaceae bacterium]